VCLSVCVYVCLSLATFPHYCMDPDVIWGKSSGCPLVVHCLADLQLVHRFHCCDIIAPKAKRQRVLVLALCLVHVVVMLAFGVSVGSQSDSAGAATCRRPLQRLFLWLASDVHCPANHVAFTTISTKHSQTGCSELTS